VEAGQGTGGAAPEGAPSRGPEAPERQPTGLEAPERPQPGPAPAAAGEPPRPLRGLGKAVIGLLVLVTAVNLAALWADAIDLGLVTDVRDGQRVSLEELRASEDRVVTIGLLQMGMYIACGIAFLIWYGRAYRNLERLGARGLKWGKRWAIVAWFIPFANLVVPKRVMNAIWRASDPHLPATANHWDQIRVPALFHWWWGLWILSSIVANILLRDTLDAAETPDEMVATGTQFVVTDVIDIVPAILAILVVRATTNRQEERRARYERGELPATGPAPSDSPAAAPAALPG
jgi:Domain of unknown function (DUF4328)